MSNFDIDKISSKLAQKGHFVCNFYYKKIFILGSLNNTKNTKEQSFGDTQYQNKKEISSLMSCISRFCTGIVYTEINAVLMFKDFSV